MTLEERITALENRLDTMTSAVKKLLDGSLKLLERVERIEDPEGAEIMQAMRAGRKAEFMGPDKD